MASKAQVISIRCRSAGCGDCVLSKECVAAAGGDEPAQFAVTPRIMRQGSHLFRDGDRFDALFVLRSGAVKTYVTTETGDDQVIGFHMPGEVLGLDAVDGGHHQCNAVALDTCSACTLPFAKLTNLCVNSTTAFRRLLERLSHKTQHDEKMLLTLGQKSADQRIASFLLDQADRQSRYGMSRHEINLPMSRSDIASYLALAGETLSRVITRLQAAGVVVAERHRIHILDEESMTAIADGRVDVPFGGTRRISGLG